MAISERHLRARFGADVCDHHVFGICSDGDLMEGISHEAASLAVRQERAAILGLKVTTGEIKCGFDDSVGQVGNLPNDGFDRLIANDVTIGDAKRFATLEPAERSQHFAVVAHCPDFGDDLLDERGRRDRLAFSHPQQVVRLFIGDQEVAQVLARGEDLQQVG